jgi:putative N6-adenine-specific DNA methylase
MLDISGEPLFKRGYRVEGGAAPLRETVAATLLLLAGWKRKFPLYDPFCGSGTIAIEAALYAWNIAPGLSRRFQFERLNPHDEQLAEEVRQELTGAIDTEREVRIFGSDMDGRAIRLAKENISRALDYNKFMTNKALQACSTAAVHGGRNASHPSSMTVPIHFITLPFEEAWPPSVLDGEAGFIVTNPPYGKRLGELEDAEAMYQRMGVLDERFPGWRLGVICDHAGFESFFGRKADSCREITNGAAGAFFYQYSLGE